MQSTLSMGLERNVSASVLYRVPQNVQSCVGSPLKRTRINVSPVPCHSWSRSWLCQVLGAHHTWPKPVLVLGFFPRPGAVPPARLIAPHPYRARLWIFVSWETLAV